MYGLDEVGLHVEIYRSSVGELAYGVYPLVHGGDAVLSGEALEQMEVTLACFAHQDGSLIVVVGGVFEGRVGVAYQAGISSEWQRVCPSYVFLAEHCSFGDRVVHVFFLELPFALSPYLVNFLESLSLRPRGLSVAVEDIDAAVPEGLIVGQACQHGGL